MPARELRPDPVTRGTYGDRDAHATYDRGLRHEQAGNLERAARCFRRAAEAGHPDAALRLGRVLGRLADRQSAAERSGVKAKQTPEMLIAEATRWLSGVKPSPDAIELITDLLNRQQRLAARRTPAPLNPR